MLYLSGKNHNNKLAKHRFNKELGNSKPESKDQHDFLNLHYLFNKFVKPFITEHKLIYKLTLIVLIGIISNIIWSYFTALIVTIISIVIVQSAFSYKQQRHINNVTSQLPLFIDQLIRSLATGKSIESAFRLVTNNTPAPLGDIFRRVINTTDLGSSLTESLFNEAKASNINELHIVALSMKISNKYGSSPREMLESVMHMINNKEQARRELNALTGETKISALILIAVPLMILIYTFAMNPVYIEMMTSDSTGLIMFRLAILMQLCGAFIFWRMLKSI